MSEKESAQGEHLVMALNEHWVKYVRVIFVYILLLACSAFFFYLAGLIAYHNDVLSQLSLLAAISLALFDHHWFFMAVLSQSENHILITNKRVIWIRHRLFFDEELHEYAFDKMKTVEATKKSILQYIFQYGTLSFESGNPIPYVPHPNTIVRTIEQVMGMS